MRKATQKTNNKGITRKLQAVLITISTLLLILGSASLSLSMSNAYNALLIVSCSMISLFAAFIISDN